MCHKSICKNLNSGISRNKSGGKLCVPRLDRDFLGVPPKHDQHTQKDTVKKKERQATN